MTLVSMIVGSVLFLVVVGTLPTAILEQEVSAAAQELEGDHVPLPTARCDCTHRSCTALKCTTLSNSCLPVLEFVGKQHFESL